MSKPWNLRDMQAEARDFLQSGSVVPMEMGVGTRKARSVELGERATRENFALYSTFPGSGKRELLLAGLPAGSAIMVVCPGPLRDFWVRLANEAGHKATTHTPQLALSRPHSVIDTMLAMPMYPGSLYVKGGPTPRPADFLIVEEPRGEKTSKALAKVAIRSPRTVVVGITTGDRLARNLRNAATVLGVAPQAMPVVLLTGGPTAAPGREEGSAI